MSTRTRLTTIAALTALAAGAVALPAAADDGRPPVPAPGDPEARAALCERIPAAQERIGARIAALEGDEDAAGTIAWLGRRIGRAEGKGREDTARLLEHRAERRTERLDRLQENLARLGDAQARYCADA